jgi:hypothetical protein
MLGPGQTRMRVDESSRSRSTANFHRLSLTLIDFELVQILMRVDKSFRYRAVISSQLSCNSCSQLTGA